MKSCLVKNAIAKIDVGGKLFFAEASTGPLLCFYLSKGKSTEARSHLCQLVFVSWMTITLSSLCFVMVALT